MSPRQPKITLVLGSGGARGLAHIGVIRSLEENQIPIHSIVGTSIGAVIGGLYAAGVTVREMEQIVRSVDRLTVAGMLMPGLSATGISASKRMRRFIASLIGDRRIEDLTIPFCAVATDLITGEEVGFERGPLVDALLASSAIPGMFQPVIHEGRYLVDGGLSNPLPISVALQSAGAVCIAVNAAPNPDRLRKRIQQKLRREPRSARPVLPAWFVDVLQARKRRLAIAGLRKRSPAVTKLRDEYSPTALRVSLQSIAISAHNLIQQQLKHTQPDLLISPRIEDFDMLEFYKGVEIMRCGYAATRAVIPEVRALLR
jgi:NTE family protein